MNSWKTTIGLLLVLAVSLGWALRPVSVAEAPISDASAAVAEVPEQLARKQHVERGKRPRRERNLLRLQTTKSLEEQRLHDLSLFRLFQENFCQVTWEAASRQRYPEDMSDLEILAKEREARLQDDHERFLALEDYVLDTDFTELTEEEQDDVYQYYEWRRRLDEARSSYFDTPEATWLELFRTRRRLYRPYELLKRQYAHDNAKMELEEALQGFFPGVGGTGAEFPVNGRNVKISGLCPQTVGIPPQKPW